MMKPHIGQQVSTAKGPGSIEKVYYGTITMLNPRRRFVLCTVLLNTPYTVKMGRYEHKAERIEAAVPLYRSRVYDHA